MNIIFRNNTGNKTKEALINGFVVRTKCFKIIYKEIADSLSDKPEQNYLIIGQRGAGKTTLLYRLKYEIEDGVKTIKRLIPVMLSEEQYNLTELSDLWETVSEQVEEDTEFTGLTDKIKAAAVSNHYEEQAFEILQAALKKNNKKVVLFLENIDVFFKKIGITGQKRLREVLLSTSYLRIIATSTNYFEAITDYSKPFYEFFKVIELKGLSRDEAVEMMLRIGEETGQRDQIEILIAKNPKRIESLRRLTGGNPRIISYLFQIFLDNANGKALKDLYQLIDTLTFLYKSELDQLSTQQQKIIDIIAKNWDAIGVKDIASKTRYESKVVSSVLQVLEKNQLVEIVPTKTKNNLYRISDRFMNIWYLMRFGKRQEKDNVIWLVRFYDVWCDKEELAKQITKHINNLKDGKYDLTAALYMGNTFLSCENAPDDLKYSLYKTTKAVLPKNFLQQLKNYSDVQLYDRMNKLIKAKKFTEAIEILDEFEKKDEKYYNFASFVYSYSKDYVQAEATAEKVFELNPSDSRTAFRIAYFNDVKLDNKQKAIKFYQIALDLGEYRAANMLGDIYLKDKDLDSAEKFHLLAIQHEQPSSFSSLAFISMVRGDMEKAEYFSKQAIANNIEKENIHLGILYQMQGKFDKADTAYKRALKNNFPIALVYLGALSMIRKIPNLKKAEHYFTEAYQRNVPRAPFYLGKFYIESEDPEKKTRGLEILTGEAKKQDKDSIHYLGHYYADQKNFRESDRYFLEAFKLGRKTALLCLTNSYILHNRSDKRKDALDLMQENIEAINEIGTAAKLEYAFIQLWNDQIEASLKYLHTQLKEIQVAFESKDDDLINPVLGSLTQYAIGLMAKGRYKALYELFSIDKSTVDFKQVMKPIYFALMSFMKEEFPKEYLKAGQELKDTVEEVIKDVERMKETI